ncbi:hypothetical protein RHSIM_Rhsim11G0118900 [Rhododendron simsii]|uniref:Uncharacterized protein n=1 Tax=Rhododendron simsii TaxID=118357 RepID=A0A834GB19_RHOSS|nr:hypothetical protein RHSIM_Rhsim11G0118900 [Rhododendron simsii]
MYVLDGTLILFFSTSISKSFLTEPRTCTASFKLSQISSGLSESETLRVSQNACLASETACTNPAVAPTTPVTAPIVANGSAIKKLRTRSGRPGRSKFRENLSKNGLTAVLYELL